MINLQLISSITVKKICYTVLCTMNYVVQLNLSGLKREKKRWSTCKPKAVSQFIIMIHGQTNKNEDAWFRTLSIIIASSYIYIYCHWNRYSHSRFFYNAYILSLSINGLLMWYDVCVEYMIVQMITIVRYKIGVCFCMCRWWCWSDQKHVFVTVIVT